MNENTSKDELIEQYLLGHLSGDQLAEFNKKLLTDSELQKEVDLQKTFVRNIKLAGRREWKRKLENIHQEMIAGGDTEKPQPAVISIGRSSTKKYLLGAAAAAAAVVILCTWWLGQNSNEGNERLFAAYYKPYVNIDQTTRSVPSTAPTERTEAFQAYDKGDYARSVGLFKKILAKGDDEAVLFYLGNACLSDNQFREAETAFKDYLNKYREFASEAGWYLGLSYIRQGKMKEALPLLKEQVRQKGSFSKEAAEILLKQ